MSVHISLCRKCLDNIQINEEGDKLSDKLTDIEKDVICEFAAGLVAGWCSEAYKTTKPELKSEYEMMLIYKRGLLVKCMVNSGKIFNAIRVKYEDLKAPEQAGQTDSGLVNF